MSFYSHGGREREEGAGVERESGVCHLLYTWSTIRVFQSALSFSIYISIACPSPNLLRLLVGKCIAKTTTTLDAILTIDNLGVKELVGVKGVKKAWRATHICGVFGEKEIPNL
ncbi:hypothetical protein CsSME_00026488 [Camellia sinensis var. sinensis]